MPYFYVEPDVAIRLGDRTVMDTSTHPPKLSYLHVVMEGWFGDHLIETFPSFVFSEELSLAITEASLTGVNFNKLEMTKGDFFNTSFPDTKLPKFVWGRINGQKMHDDFFIAKDLRLVVSGKALELLKKYGVDRASIEKY